MLHRKHPQIRELFVEETHGELQGGNSECFKEHLKCQYEF